MRVTEIALGDLVMATGYFVPRQPLPAELGAKIGARARSGDLELVSSHGGVSSLKDAAIALIEGAKRTVFLASFFLGDRDLLEALSRAAERMRGGVYLVTAISDAALRQGLAEVDDTAPAEEQARAKQFPLLAGRGLAIRGHDACHAKFLVVDREVALVSTANFDTPGFEKTTELGLVVRDRAPVRQLRALFARVWAESSWEIGSGDTYVLSRRDADTPRRALVVAPESDPEILWTVSDDFRIHERIKTLIDSAERELLLCSYSLRGLAAKPEVVLDALDAFRHRTGIAPRMLVRARNHIEGMRRDAGALASVGVELLADSETHIKAIVADAHDAVLTSANFDVNHGLLGGVEAGVRFSAPPLVGAVRDFTKRLLASAPYEFLPRVTAGALARSRLARADIWPFPSRLPVRSSEAAWDALRRGALEGPALFQTTEGNVSLSVGTCRFRLVALEARVAALELLPTEGPPSESLLDRWFREGPVRGEHRGVCDATLVKA